MIKRIDLPAILILVPALLAVPATAQAAWLMKWKDTIEGEHRDALEVDLLRPSATLLAGSRGPGQAVVRLREPLARHPALARAVQSSQPLPVVILSEGPGASPSRGTYLKYELEKVSIVSIELQTLSLDYERIKSAYTASSSTSSSAGTPMREQILARLEREGLEEAR